MYKIFSSILLYMIPNAPHLHLAIYFKMSWIFKFLVFMSEDVDTKALGLIDFYIDKLNIFNIIILLLDILTYDTDVMYENLFGNTPLMLAIKMKRISFVETLIKNRANLQIKSGKENVTPLNYAISVNNFFITKLLIDNGADENIQDNDGMFPIFKSIDNRNILIFNYMLNKGFNPNLLYNGKPCLYYAIKEDFTEGVESLCTHSGSSESVNVMYNDITPLQWTLRYSTNNTIINILLDYGANINVSYHNSLSPLSYCIKKSNINIFYTLLRRGADVNMPNHNGKYPIEYLYERPNLAILVHMLTNGVKKKMIEKNTFINMFIKYPNFLKYFLYFKGHDSYKCYVFRNVLPIECISHIESFLQPDCTPIELLQYEKKLLSI